MPHTLTHALPADYYVPDRVIPDCPGHLSPWSYAYGPDGMLHVLMRASSEHPGPATPFYYAWFLTSYDSQGVAQRVLDLDAFYQRVHRCGSELAHVGVTSKGDLVLTALNNMGFVISADGQRLLSRHDHFYGASMKTPLNVRDNLGFEVIRDPDGRLLCGMSIYRYGHVNAFNDLCIGVGDDSLRFRHVAHYETRIPKAQELIYHHIEHDGKPYNTGHPRGPSLKEQLSTSSALNGRFLVREPYFLSHRRLVPISDHRFVLPVYYMGVAHVSHSEIFFLIVDYEGKMVGYLRGIQENPAVSEQGDVVYDPRHRRIVHKSDKALYFFHSDGRSQGRLPFDDLAPYRKLRLRACSEDGRMVLLDPADASSLVLDPIARPEDAVTVLKDGLLALRKARRARKATGRPLDHRAPLVLGLEPVQHPPADWSLG